MSADVNDVGVDKVLLSREFQFDADEVLAAVTPNTKIIFICSPNNPTANDIDRAQVIALLESGYRGLVVVDEVRACGACCPLFVAAHAPVVAFGDDVAITKMLALTDTYHTFTFHGDVVMHCLTPTQGLRGLQRPGELRAAGGQAP